MPVVAAISDLHGVLPRKPNGLPDVPACDVLALAGDICPDFTHSSFDKGEARQSGWLDTDFREWLFDVPAEHVVAIGGNHDFVFDIGIAPKLPWTYLQDAESRVAGLNFYGVPWCPKLGRWAFYAADRRLRYIYEAVPKDLDVLISHSPPHGYGDWVPPHSRFNPSDERVHVGTAQLTNILYEKRPKVVISGHIHEARGRYEYHGGTAVYNVSYLTDDYQPHDKPACTIISEFE